MSINDANYWLKLKKEYENEKNTIDKIITKLEIIYNNLKEVPNDLKDSENEFKNGGYYDDEILHRGVLKYCYTHLEEKNSEISNVINKSKILVNELNSKITKCYIKYLECINKQG